MAFGLLSSTNAFSENAFLDTKCAKHTVDFKFKTVFLWLLWQRWADGCDGQWATFDVWIFCSVSDILSLLVWLQSLSYVLEKRPKEKECAAKFVGQMVNIEHNRQIVGYIFRIIQILVFQIFVIFFNAIFGLLHSKSLPIAYCICTHGYLCFSG